MKQPPGHARRPPACAPCMHISFAHDEAVSRVRKPLSAQVCKKPTSLERPGSLSRRPGALAGRMAGKALKVSPSMPWHNGVTMQPFRQGYLRNVGSGVLSCWGAPGGPHGWRGAEYEALQALAHGIGGVQPAAQPIRRCRPAAVWHAPPRRHERLWRAPPCAARHPQPARAVAAGSTAPPYTSPQNAFQCSPPVQTPIQPVGSKLQKA